MRIEPVVKNPAGRQNRSVPVDYAQTTGESGRYNDVWRPLETCPDRAICQLAPDSRQQDANVDLPYMAHKAGMGTQVCPTEAPQLTPRREFIVECKCYENL